MYRRFDVVFPLSSPPSLSLSFLLPSMFGKLLFSDPVNNFITTICLFYMIIGRESHFLQWMEIMDKSFAKFFDTPSFYYIHASLLYFEWENKKKLVFFFLDPQFNVIYHWFLWLEISIKIEC